MAKMEKSNQRQVLPTDMFDKKFKQNDGTYLTPDAENTRKKLADAEALVLKNHVREERVPEKELVEASATVMGVNPRSGIPYLYGPAVRLLSDKFSSKGSQSWASSQRSRSPPSADYAQDLRSRLERMDEYQSRQADEIRSMKESIDRLTQIMQMQADMLRMFAPGYRTPPSQSPNGNNCGLSSQRSDEDNRRD